MQRTEIFVAMVIYPRFEGAAHRNIKFNVIIILAVFSQMYFKADQVFYYDLYLFD